MLIRINRLLAILSINVQEIFSNRVLYAIVVLATISTINAVVLTLGYLTIVTFALGLDDHLEVVALCNFATVSRVW